MRAKRDKLDFIKFSLSDQDDKIKRQATVYNLLSVTYYI